MNSSITSESSESSKFTTALLNTLEECSEDSVYAPGYIQPHGILLTLQEPDLTIVQVSENLEQFLGIAASAALGQPLQQLFPSAQIQHLINCLQQHDLEYCNPFELQLCSTVFAPAILSTTAAVTEQHCIFRSTLHRTSDALILELEPEQTTERTPSIQFYHRLQSAILRLRKATSLSELAQTLAHEVKAIAGFDRVMVYQFAADEHGVVIAEAKESHLESYLGLHYPATDVPAPSRQLFLRNWLRVIPAIAAAPVPLLPVLNPLTQRPLNIGDCVLRGVHHSHVEYLQNMGVAGSMTISLIDDQRLWGLIACHHDTPRLVDYEIRKTCEFLGQFASIELIHQQERELDHYQAQVKEIQEQLQQAFLREPHFIQQVLMRHATELLDLVHATGVAIVLDQQISLLGETPSLEGIQTLLTGLACLNQQDIYLTHSLSRLYSPASAFKAIASGMLTISIVLHQKSYHLLWFRPEQIQTITWAGNPQEAIAIDALGKLKLCPRKSFEQWKETVQETSLPWQPAEIEAARMLRNTLMLAVLEFSQAALEQAAERAMIANRAKSQFLAKMSHELRTPLNAILGFTQVMHHSPNTPAEFQEHLGIISRSGEHLLALINDVLEMSRIEAGQLVLTERYFNLHRLLQGLHDLFALKASQKGIELTFEEAEELPHHVCGDEGKLRQILINLISNAIKFTAQGRVIIRVKTYTTGTTNPQGCTCYPNSTACCHVRTLAFAIEDTGCGIETADLDSIFDVFVQTEQGHHAEGTGLGLSISRQLACLMGGDITVQSTVNQGSIFTCWVRVHQPDMLNLLEPETRHPVIGLAPGQPSYRILVVEDVLENQQLLKTLLEPIGFEVAVVENGIAAIAHWRTWHPHLILMDIQMPVMDGYDATRQIRSQEQMHNRTEAHSAAHPPTKIIALTAYAFETDRTSSLEAGCDGYLAKPFTETALFDAIARQLDVKYRYADRASRPSVSAATALTRKDLRIMSFAWIAQVHEAALDLNDQKICQLMAEIPPQETALIEGLTDLVNNFQLDAIANLTQL